MSAPPDIPGVFHAEALTAGLDEQEIAYRWAKASAYVQQRGWSEVTPRRWRLEVEWAVADAKKRVSLAATERIANAALLEERRRHREEMAAYKRNAVTFEQWMSSLEQDDAIPLDPLVGELHAWWLSQPEPRPSGSIAIVAWMASRRPRRAVSHPERTATEELERLQAWADETQSGERIIDPSPDELPF